MRRHRTLAALAVTAAVAPLGAQAPEGIWYTTASQASVSSFLAHAAQITAVAPQVFAFDRNGSIHGSLDARLVARAHEAGVKLIPLVVNPGFDQPLVHRILTVPAARTRAIASLVTLCTANHLDGIQFDLENVNASDRDAFTHFVAASADAVHAARCTLSAAVVPRTSDSPGATPFDKWMFQNWRGAYDYKALAAALDFLSYMTYAQHTGGTTPGPVAGYSWMEAALQHVLSLGVPPSKISLGIPTYSDWWYPSYTKKAGEHGSGMDIGYAKAESLLHVNNAKTIWDERDRAPFAYWTSHDAYQWLWIEDARAFAAKLALVKQYGLRGYSVWVLGLEDPAVWTTAGVAR